ncbi:MAG: Asp/Glu racemase [Paracoccaceae bacterium]
MISAPYELDTLQDPVLGLIVLQADETIESDFRTLFASTPARIHVTRIPSGADLTADSISQMKRDLPQAASLLPRAPSFAAIGYACTSGTTLIGARAVAGLVRDGCDTAVVSDPLSAVIKACSALNIKRLGIISPYSIDIAQPVQSALEDAGLQIPHAITFDEPTEANVVRISASSLVRAAHALVAHTQVDGVFMSCTNLRTMNVIPKLEKDLGMPVLSSNHSLAWDMSHAAGIELAPNWGGKLFQV